MSSAHRRYYTPKEISQHNCAEDCWVSIFHKVYDLTPFISENRGPLAQPIILHAGEDLSHWFDEESGNVKSHMDPVRHIRVPFLPHGRFCHVGPPEPVTTWSTMNDTPAWWENEEFCIGKLSDKTRWVNIVNTLTHQNHRLEVCSEDTVNEIQDRYQEWNAHTTSYTWKYLQLEEFVMLDMTKTLIENGAQDDTDELEKIGILNDEFILTLHIYYNDDLTIQ